MKQVVGKPTNPWIHHNPGIITWMLTGTSSFTWHGSNAPISSKTPTTPKPGRHTKSPGRARIAKQQEGKYDQYDIDYWASVVHLSRGNVHTDLTTGTFNTLYGDFLPESETQQPAVASKVTSAIRTGLLGSIQWLDNIVYLPVYLMAAGQLLSEKAFQYSGYNLGMFNDDHGVPISSPITGWRAGLAWAAFIVAGLFALSFRAAKFVLKPFADAAGFLLNVANIAAVGVSGLVTMAMKTFTQNPELGSYTKILRGMLVDIVFPFSWEMGNAMAQNLALTDSGVLGEKLRGQRNYNAIEVPPISWRTIASYGVAIAAVGFFAATTGGLGFISQPLIPWLAQFVGGIFGGEGVLAAAQAAQTTAFAVNPATIATATTIGGTLFGFIGSFFDNTIKATMDIAKPVQEVPIEKSTIVPAPTVAESAISLITGEKKQSIDTQKKFSDKLKQNQNTSSQPGELPNQSPPNSNPPSKESGLDTEGYYGTKEKPDQFPEPGNIKIVPDTDGSSNKSSQGNDEDQEEKKHDENKPGF